VASDPKFEDFPEEIQKMMVKGGKFFAGLKDLKNKTALMNAIGKSWTGAPALESIQPIDEMDDAGLDKALIILDKVTRDVESVRHARQIKKSKRKADGGDD
jgi:hypothetical protein